MKRIFIIVALLISTIAINAQPKGISKIPTPHQNYNERLSDYTALVEQHNLRPYCNVEFMDDASSAGDMSFFAQKKGTLSAMGTVNIENFNSTPHPAYNVNSTTMRYGLDWVEKKKMDFLKRTSII